MEEADNTHPNQIKPAKRPEREVPKQVRFTTSGLVHRNLTWRERIKAALGFAIILEVHIASEHNPGRTQPMSKLHFTPIHNAEEAIVAHRKQAQAEMEAQKAKEAK